MEGCAFDRAGRSVTVSVAGAGAVRFELALPDVRAVEAEPATADRAYQGWTVSAVGAPVDDRRLLVELTRPGRFKGSPERRAVLEVSAVPVARGAVLRDAGGKRLAAVGAAPPPAVDPRPVLDASAVTAACRAQDVDALLGGRWLSPAIARLLCAEPDRAAERYELICSDAPARPARCDGLLVPFPLCDGALPVPSLVEPAAERGASPGAAGAARHTRARARMEAELERAHDAPRVRALADALLALGTAAPPATVVLAGGASAPVPARPGETCADVAARLYAEARSKERALALLPARLAAFPAAVGAPDPAPRAAHAARTAKAAPRAPYRTYRSSSGLDIWVGRGAASNDALTFHAAAPDDVWLHARDAAGAHVVLRWSKPENPPARDLREAALLAAWHSRARGSTVVPVDWTRRKHVRKPRGAAAGAVNVDRARTVMVRPSAEAERRLRPPPGTAPS